MLNGTIPNQNPFIGANRLLAERPGDEVVGDGIRGGLLMKLPECARVGVVGGVHAPGGLANNKSRISSTSRMEPNVW